MDCTDINNALSMVKAAQGSGAVENFLGGMGALQGFFKQQMTGILYRARQQLMDRLSAATAMRDNVLAPRKLQLEALRAAIENMASIPGMPTLPDFPSLPNICGIGISMPDFMDQISFAESDVADRLSAVNSNIDATQGQVDRLNTLLDGAPGGIGRTKVMDSAVSYRSLVDRDQWAPELEAVGMPDLDFDVPDGLPLPI